MSGGSQPRCRPFCMAALLVSRMRITAIDLFCGAGGLSLGLEQAGVSVVAGFDNCADSLSTFCSNHEHSVGINCDLSNPIQGLSKFSGVDLVVGSPPCQGFSISGKRDPEDTRNNLYRAYIDTLRQLEPKVFLMENVPHLVSMDQGRFPSQIIKDLGSLGYHVTFKVLLASRFGVPQSRRRVFFVGSKDRALTLTEPSLESCLLTCKDAISDLPETSVADGDNYPAKAESDFQKLMRERSSGLWNHQVTKHSQKTVDIISLVPDGGNYKDLPRELQNTRKVHIAWTRYHSEKPSFTIDTGHRHHFHYTFNRVPTVRESARLQSFPDTFIFKASRTSQYKQVGNAVPPMLAKALMEQIIAAGLL